MMSKGNCPSSTGSKLDLMNKQASNKGQKKTRNPKETLQRKNLVNLDGYYQLAGLAAVLILGIIIYSNTFNCSFHFDDSQNIVNNAKIRDLWNIKAWWNFYPSRPVAMFTFALNYHFNHLNIWGYHSINLIIHLINACLVWWLTLLIFSSPAVKDNKVAKQKKIIAFFTALLFISHPLATQSVTYIVQRMTSMAAMFYMLSVALYMKARLSERVNGVKYFLLAGCLLSAVAAMLTKEIAFTLPLTVIMAELFFFKRKMVSVNFKDYRLLFLIALFIVPVMIILYLRSASNVFTAIGPTNGHTYTLTPFSYLLTQFSVIVKYIQLLFLPVNQMVDYDFPVSTRFFEPRTLLSFLFLLSLVILGIFLYKKQRVISFGIFWFFITLMVESGIIPIADLIFEHRTYLPSFGFFFILSSVISGLLWNRYKFLAIIILLMITGSGSLLTYERNKAWKDDLSLWNDNVLKAPNLVRPVSNRGAAYAELGLWDNAIADCNSAIRINPDFPAAYLTRGFAFDNLNQPDKAMADYSKAISINSDYAEAYSDRGAMYAKLGQWDNAIADYSRVIEINPEAVRAYISRATAYENTGQWDKATDDYTSAIGINPDFAQAWLNRGVIFSNLREWDKAIADYSRAIGINPNYTEAYFNRGAVYANLGQWNNALSDCSKAIEFNPDSKEAYFNRGNIYETLKQWDQAISDYSRVIEIDPMTIQAYVNRGVAFQNIGQWEKAIEDYTRALRIDPNFTIAYNNREIAYRNLKK